MSPTRPHLLWLSCRRRLCPSTVARRSPSAGLVALSALCWLFLWPSSARAQVGTVLQTSSSSIGTVVTSDQIQDLPSKTRGITDLLSLTPGIGYVSGDSEQTSLWSSNTPGGPLNLIAKRGDSVPNNQGFLIDRIEDFLGPNASGNTLVSFDANTGDGVDHQFLEIYNGTGFSNLISSDATNTFTNAPFGRLEIRAFSDSGVAYFKARSGLYSQFLGAQPTAIALVGATAPGPQTGTFVDVDMNRISVNALGQVLVNGTVNVSGALLDSIHQWNPGSPTGSLSYVALSGNAGPGGSTIPPLGFGFQNDIGYIAFVVRSLSNSPYQILEWNPGSMTLNQVLINPTLQPPTGITGGNGIITGVTDVFGYDNNRTIYFSGSVGPATPPTAPFTNAVLGSFKTTNSTFAMLAFDKQPAPGVTGKTFSLTNDFSFRNTFNGALAIKFQYNEGGFGLFNQYGSNSLTKVATDGEAAPHGGTWKLSTTFRFQAFDSGQVRFGAATSGGPKWVDTLFTPPATLGGLPTFIKLQSTDDPLPNSSTVYLGEDFTLSGNYALFKAWRSGGPASVYAKERFSGVTTRFYGEGDPIGTTGYLGPLSECSPFIFDPGLQAVFQGKIYGADTPISGIFQSGINLPLTKIVGTGDPSSISGLTYTFKRDKSFFDVSLGRIAYFDYLSDGSQALSLYDPSPAASVHNQIIFSNFDTIPPSTSVQSFKFETLKFRSPYLIFSAQTTVGTTQGTSYLFFNSLTPTSVPQVINAGTLYQRGILRKLSLNLDLNYNGGFAYLNSLGPTTNGIALDAGGVTTSLAQDGQVLGAGNIAITGQDSAGRSFLISDFRLNFFGNDFLLRSAFTGGTNSGYSRFLSGKALTPLIQQGQVWTNFGTIGNIPTGRGNRDINVSLDGKVTFSVPFTKSSNGKMSNALLWVGTDGTVWKDYATGDTFSPLSKTILNFGVPLAVNTAFGEIGNKQTYTDASEALLVIDSPTGTNTTSTAVATPSNTTTVGLPVQFTATVTNTSGTSTVPTGNVSLQVNGVESGVGILDSTGKATIFVPSFTPGTYGITGRYQGDMNFMTSQSVPITLVSKVIPTTTTVKSSLNPSGTGQAVTFTATVIGASSFSSLPSGMVKFYDGGTTLIGTGTLNSNMADYTTSTLSVGTHSITATYPGDSNYGTSTSLTPVSQVVNGISSTTALSASTTTPAAGQDVTFNVTVTIGTGGSTAGDVFLSDANDVTFADSVPTDASGKGSMKDHFTVGTHVLTAMFSGNSTTAQSTSNTVTLTVSGAWFATVPPQSVTAGQPFTVGLTLYGAAGAVYNLSASNLPANSSSSFSSNPVTASPAGTTFQFMLTTHAATPPSQRRKPGAPLGLQGLEISLAAATLALLLSWWRFPRRLLACGTATAALLLLAIVMIGCNTTYSGGGGGGGSGSTPKGNAAITITAMPVGGGAPVNTVVNVNIQ